MNSGDGALLTDLYQLTMLQGYRDAGMRERAVFEFFIRKLPEQRRFLLAAGLEQVLEYLENLHFEPRELAWLRACGKFDTAFVDTLAEFRFSGDVDALPEGTLCFADEPLLRISAPLPEAQFVESRVINLLHFQTLIASKAARCVLAAPGKQLIDFGMRRAHGAEAATLASRAAYLAGFDGTATVTAGVRFGIPVFGTMAHSFIEAHAGEAAAFRAFALSQPDNIVLLIDTYDSAQAARKVGRLARELATRGIRIRAVRIDSGDLREETHRARAILDEEGLADVGIFVSGNLDEYAIARLLAAGAPIDGFGVGTQMTTSHDLPSLDCAYKLQEYAGVARRKRSPGKATWPGAKQVWRTFDAAGRPCADRVTLAHEHGPEQSRALLVPVMRHGRRIAEPHPLAALRDTVAEQLARLPESLTRLSGGPHYPVSIAPSLLSLADDIDRQVAT